MLQDDNVKKITLKKILRLVFNTNSHGEIEVIKMPDNKEELIFKLKTSDKPFALIKIGDISPWLKQKLDGYEISESYENKSFFKTISEDNNFVNILMGSRAFYEGWDSNRPNVMVFINIGKGDAKKYITQSIGRGVRIEPLKAKRKRLHALKKENDVSAKDVSSKLSLDSISLMESLFVFGTNKKNVEEILESVKYERKSSGEIIQLQTNEESKDKILLIPIYKNRKKIVDVKEMPKFEGDKEILSRFVDWLEDDRIIYALFSHEPHVNIENILKARNFLQDGKFSSMNNLDVYSQLNKLMKHTDIIFQDLDQFKSLADEIVHFKRIRVTLDDNDLQNLKILIEKVKDYKDSSKKESELKTLLEERKIGVEEFTSEIKKLGSASKEEKFTASGSTLIIKNILNHYYVPVILSENERLDYINHIINVESERKFINQLEEFISKKDNLFNSFDWWLFSKMDEHLDEVHIPYYDRANNRIERFKPDFIFWLKKGNQYFIVFVDPKGTKHTDYEYKVDGYSMIFEENNGKKGFSENEYNVCVHLFLKTDDVNKLSEGYKKYWFDDIQSMVKTVLQKESVVI